MRAPFSRRMMWNALRRFAQSGARFANNFLAQKILKGITWLDDILCSAVSQGAVKIAGQEATAVLRDRHHLRPEEEDDFNIRNPEDIIQAQLEASKTLTVLLIAIASVSLIVGG